MPHLQQNHNSIARPAALTAEVVRSTIDDEVNGSLAPGHAAQKIVQRIDVRTEQLLAVAIDMLREQAIRHAEAITELRGELEGDIARLEDETADFKIEIGRLHAKLKKAGTRSAR